jgi:hypothetical protein
LKIGPTSMADNKKYVTLQYITLQIPSYTWATEHIIHFNITQNQFLFPLNPFLHFNRTFFLSMYWKKYITKSVQ